MPPKRWHNSGMKEQHEVKITVRFPADVIEALRRLAHQHERSLNGEIVWAVRTYVLQHQQPEKDNKHEQP